MNKYYVLNNSNDKTLFLKNESCDTRLVSESKRFTDRRLAEKYLKTRNMSESYHVQMISNRRKINESVDSIADIVEDIQLAIDDTKDYIDTTLDFINSYRDNDDLKEAIEGASNISDVVDKLEKVKKYMNGIMFTPSFDNSLGALQGSSDQGGDSLG